MILGICEKGEKIDKKVHIIRKHSCKSTKSRASLTGVFQPCSRSLNLGVTSTPGRLGTDRKLCSVSGTERNSFPQGAVQDESCWGETRSLHQQQFLQDWNYHILNNAIVQTLWELSSGPPRSPRLLWKISMVTANRFKKTDSRACDPLYD